MIDNKSKKDFLIKEIEAITKLKEEMFKRAFKSYTDKGCTIAALAYANLVRSELKLRKQQNKPS